MKHALTILSLLIYAFSFSQEKKIFNSNSEPFVLKCKTIADGIIDKHKSSDINNWYEGLHKDRTLSSIRELESDIAASKLNVTYHLILMSEEKLLYTIHFYNEETKTEFGQLFLNFKDKENDLVDNIAFVSMSKLKESPDSFKDNSGFINIPPPPPPPPPPPIKNEKRN